MANYAAYIDDSGHPDGQPYVVAAGFLGSEESWQAFEPDWKNALARNGLGEVFHMTDFMAAKRRQAERRRILTDLESVIARHVHVSFSGTVDVAVYRKVNEVYAVEECLGAPYALAARTMALAINRWKAANFREGDKLVLFAENGTKHRGDMEQVFQRDKLPYPQTVAKSVVPVQPADMLAWLIFTGLRDDSISRRARRLAGDNPDFHVVLHEPDLLETCEAAKVLARKDIVPGKSSIAFHSNPKRERKRTIR